MKLFGIALENFYVVGLFLYHIRWKVNIPRRKGKKDEMSCSKFSQISNWKNFVPSDLLSELIFFTGFIRTIFHRTKIRLSQAYPHNLNLFRRFVRKFSCNRGNKKSIFFPNSISKITLFEYYFNESGFSKPITSWKPRVKNENRSIVRL